MPSFTDSTTEGRLRQSIVWNYAGHFFQIAINFALTFILARHLPVQEYGLLLFVLALTNSLYLLDIGISSVLVQHFVSAATRGENEELHDLLSTAFLALAALGTLALAVAAILIAILPGPFDIPRELVPESRILFFIGALIIQTLLPTMAIEMAYQAAHRFDRLNQTQLVCTALQFALSLAVLAAGHGIVALAWVQLGTGALRSLMLVLGLPRAVSGLRLSLRRFRLPLLRPLLETSRWAFLHNATATGVDFLIWTLLGTLGSMREAALYGIAGKLPRQLWNLVDRGANVTLPLLSRYFAEGNQPALRQTFANLHKLVFGAVLPFILLGCAFARPLIHLLAGDRYTEAATVMQWLLLGAMASAILYSSDLLLYACNHVRKAALISLVAGAASIVAAGILVTRFGAAGIACAFAVTQLCLGSTWFTIEACRRSGLSLSTLIRAIRSGLALPAVLLLGGTLFIIFAQRFLNPLGTVVCASLCGLLYFSVWIPQTALPLYRQQTEATE